MALTPSSMLPLGYQLPAFDLPDGSGCRYRSEALIGPAGLLVIFICNHCPYVKHIDPVLAPLGAVLAGQGIGMVAISSNDITAYPDDAPDRMQETARLLGYTFPYLYDEDQSVARAFHAACTPDPFLFDADGNLVWRGQLDGSRPGNGVADAAGLKRAVAALLAGEPPLAEQQPSIGCSIKWRTPLA